MGGRAPSDLCGAERDLDKFHFSVRINSHHVIALGGLNSFLGVRLAVELLLDEEIPPLLQVEAAVVAHEALGVVELVPSFDDGSPGEMGTAWVRPRGARGHEQHRGPLRPPAPSPSLVPLLCQGRAVGICRTQHHQAQLEQSMNYNKEKQKSTSIP